MPATRCWRSGRPDTGRRTENQEPRTKIRLSALLNVERVWKGMQFDLTGKTAIVTGAAHGFGRAITLALGRCGAAVWAVDRLADELDETAALAHQEGARCLPAFCDVTDSAAVGRLVE